MRRGTRQLICFFLALTLTLFSPSARALRGDEGMIRVGLSHGSGPMTAVNALADVGYELGYFEGDSFVSVGRLQNRYVSFARDTLLSVSGRVVRAGSSGGTAVKPYHLEVVRDFGSQEEAEGFIAAVKGEGYVGEIFPACIEGNLRVRIEMYSTAEYATADLDKISAFALGESLRVVGAESGTVTVLDLNNLAIVYELKAPAGSYAAARSAGGGTMRNSIYDYNGAFEFRRGDGDITFVNVLPMADYLKGVLPYEMSGDWPLEALKAQALCARSYALFNGGRHIGYDVCNTTHCQVYYGTARETDLVRQAVAETQNQVVTYQGKLISTYYSASSGGYTESSENAWGGSAHPYYAAVPDPYEKAEDVTTFSKTLTSAELTELVREMGGNIGTVTNCYVSQFTQPAGNVYEVTFEGTGGTYKISRTDNVRIKLSSIVRSPRFDIYSGSLRLFADGGRPLGQSELFSINGAGVVQKTPALPHILSAARLSQPTVSGDGRFTFSGAGFGHNVGMSQVGAKGMAEAGKTYREIILHYFTGVEILRADELG